MTTSPERRIELLRQLGVDVTEEMKEREYKISLDNFAEVYGADWEEKADALSFVLSDPTGYMEAKYRKSQLPPNVTASPEWLKRNTHASPKEKAIAKANGDVLDAIRDDFENFKKDQHNQW